MSADAALLRLASSCADAVVGVLEMFAPGQVTRGDAGVVGTDAHPLENVPVPAVSTMVSYVDGVTGGNLFVMTNRGARKLAAAMMGAEAEDSDGELSELELSAASEAMNQMMASAATAVSAVLDTEVEIGVPETKTFASFEEAAAAYQRTPHATRVAITVCGEPCRLVQLVPNAFVVRMTRAMDELSAAYPAAGGPGGPASGFTVPESMPGAPSLAGVRVRLSAELGRARMHSASLVGLPAGAVVELDRQADDPIDLYVNGRPFATGRLIVVDGSEWAVRIESVTGDPENMTRTEEV
jgi:flagellar motor switch protein FliN/FliY